VTGHHFSGLTRLNAKPSWSVIWNRCEEDIPYMGFFDSLFSPEKPFAL
jgi:hypothetical protein